MSWVPQPTLVFGSRGIRGGVACDWHGHLGWGIVACRPAALERVGFVVHVGNFPLHWPRDTADDTSRPNTYLRESRMSTPLGIPKCG
jgi:hypothetical protein